MYFTPVTAPFHILYIMCPNLIANKDLRVSLGQEKFYQNLRDSPYFSCTEESHVIFIHISGDKPGHIAKTNDNEVKNMIQLPDQHQ